MLTTYNFKGVGVYKVILAGGMASGKSTVAQLFVDAGGVRFDLDEVSRKLLAPGSECTCRIAEAFGTDLIDPNTQEINRKELGHRAFGSEESTKLLEDLEMPFIKAYMKHFLLEEAPQLRARFCFVEVPLLDRVEDLLDLVDEVVVVVAPKELRVQRAAGRGVSRQEFEERISHQPSDDYLIEQAQVVFENSGDLDQLKQQVAIWLQMRFDEPQKA